MSILQKKPVFVIEREIIQDPDCETDYCKELEKLDKEFNKMIKITVKKKPLIEFIKKKVAIINEIDDY